VAEAERVEVSDSLLEQAKAVYPPGGSADGTPSYELFLLGPLEAARFYFSHAFDQALRENPDSPIAYYPIVSTFFPIMGFFAARVSDHIVILDFVVDDEYLT
jgi:hypothetical protein